MNHGFIDLPGIKNARDLGGYPAGGKRIKEGALLRCGTLCKAEPGTLELLSDKYQVKHIIDFRMEETPGTIPDPEVKDAKISVLPVVEMEDYIIKAGKPELAQQYLSAAGSKDPQALYKMAYEYGMLSPEMYLLFLFGERGKKAYREFFKILISHDPSDGAVLWHCEDGKDRAGIATVLILEVLGTDRATIIEDYLLTNIGNEAKISKTRAACEASGMPPEQTEAMIFANGGVFKHYLTFTLDTIERKYGSVTDYIRQELGITDEEMNVLREKYTI